MSLTTPEGGSVIHDENMREDVACWVVSDLLHSLAAKDRLQRAARQDERLRLARELHDGLLQSLTGSALQLEAACRLIEDDPQAARQRVRSIAELLAEEQRALRAWIEKVKAATPMASEVDLAAMLEQLRQRVERDAGLRVVLTMDEPKAMPSTLGDEVYRLVQEALTNVVRHAFATIARVELKISGDRVRITVTDDGRGFPFFGSYDLAMLTDRHIGPVSLMGRVTSLRGELVVMSTPAGSRLEISLPLDQRRLRDGYSAANRAEHA